MSTPFGDPPDRNFWPEVEALGRALREKLQPGRRIEISARVIPVERPSWFLDMALTLDTHETGARHAPVTYLSTPLAVVRHIFREDPDVEVHESPTDPPWDARIIAWRKPLPDPARSWTIREVPGE